MSLVIPVKVKLRGHFHLTAINADTGEVRELADFDNLIVNQGLDFIGKGSPGNANFFYYGCSVGTGTTPVAPGDVTMQSFLAGTNTTSGASTSNPGSPNYQTLSNLTFTFATGVAAGNLTEIGIVGIASGDSSATVPHSTSPLFSHSLIMVGGSPGTITILSNEILNVVYTISMFPIITTLTGSFSLNTDGTITSVNYSILSSGAGNSSYYNANGGTPINFNVGAGNGLVYSGGLGPVTGLPMGTSAALTGATVTRGTYTAGTYFLSWTFNVPVSSGNVSPSIGAITLFQGVQGFYTPIQVAFSPGIAKTNIQTFSIVANVSWSN